MRKILFSLMLLMMLLPMAVMGQEEITANGIIKNTKGEELVGCCIFVKNTSYGTISGLEGKYNLPKVKIGDEICISYAGYCTQYYVVENERTVMTTLITVKEAKKQKKAQSKKNDDYKQYQKERKK